MLRLELFEILEISYYSLNQHFFVPFGTILLFYGLIILYMTYLQFKKTFPERETQKYVFFFETRFFFLRKRFSLGAASKFFSTQMTHVIRVIRVYNDVDANRLIKRFLLRRND